jgi:hypothetical protein
MRGISNGSATIKYNPIFDAIEVHFDQEGTMKSYHEAMEQALNLATIENVNRWVFIKNTFSDVSTDQFLLFLRKWIIRGCHILKNKGLSSLCEVAIITESESCEKLKFKFDLLKHNDQTLQDLDMNICDSEEEIYDYF